MAMQRIEDMDSLDIESMVSVILEEDHKNPTKYQMTELGDADALWNILNGNKNSSKRAFGLLHGEGQGGFRRGELNIICAGGITR